MNSEANVTQRKTLGGSAGLILGIAVLASLMTFASISADNGPKAAPARSVGAAASSRGVGSGVPLQINHQGVVQVGGVRFNGTGLFRFAIVDPDTGNYLWTNDGSSVVPPAEPTAAVSVTGIVNGVYSVNLGDASLPNMTTVSSTVFNDNNAVLRIWFDDGPASPAGVEQLTPDHPLGTSPYTFRAAKATDADTVDGLQAAELTATQPPIGSIIAWHKNLAGVPALPASWLECNGPLTDDPTTPIDESQLPNLNGEGRFLRGTTGTSGFEQPDAFQGHKHNVDTDAGTELRASGAGVVAWGSSTLARDSSDAGRYKAQNPITDGTNGAPRTDNETRPVNMSVVWIIRVK